MSSDEEELEEDYAAAFETQDIDDSNFFTINHSIKKKKQTFTRKSLSRATFTKQMGVFKKEGDVIYKSAAEAIGEVKQFLCILFGMTMRFYNAIIR